MIDALNLIYCIENDLADGVGNIETCLKQALEQGSRYCRIGLRRTGNYAGFDRHWHNPTVRCANTVMKDDKTKWKSSWNMIY